MNERLPQIIPIILGVLLVIFICLTAIFGIKFGNVNKQKSNEISAALENQSNELNTACQLEKEKTMTKYVADEVFGSFEFVYPKVWQTNVVLAVGDTEELIFLADPNIIVVDKEIENPTSALRVVVYKDKYTTKLKDSEDSNTKENPMTEKDATVSGIKGKSFVGTSADNGKQFSYVILPLRDKTLYIGTDDYNAFSKKYETILSSFKISK
jgi:hypothetical protein